MKRIMITVKLNNGEIETYFEVENFKMNPDNKLVTFECKDNTINNGEVKIYTKKVLVNLDNVYSMETVNMDEM